MARNTHRGGEDWQESLRAIAGAIPGEQREHAKKAKKPRSHGRSESLGGGSKPAESEAPVVDEEKKERVKREEANQKAYEIVGSKKGISDSRHTANLKKIWEGFDLPGKL